MNKFYEAFDAGCNAVCQPFTGLGMLGDPAGQEQERERLRGIGKWRFILLRGIIGFGCAGDGFEHLDHDVGVVRRGGCAGYPCHLEQLAAC